MSNSSRDDPLEIPGFYYDTEKKRYFRVLPGMNNHNPLTQEIIVSKKAKLDQCFAKEKAVRKNSVVLLHQRSIGMRHGPSCCSSFQSELTNVKLRNSFKTGDPDSPPHDVSVMHSTIDFSDVMLYHWQKGNRRDICVVGHRHTHAVPHCTSVSVLNFDQKGVLGACAGHSEMFWWDYGKSYHCKKTVKGRTPFACSAALNPHSKYVASFGDGNKAIFITNLESFFSSPTSHVRGGPGYSIVRLKSDILAQSFSYNPDIHFNGIRGGAIVGLDRRIPRKGSYCCYIRPSIGSCNPNVRQLRALSDEFSLIVGHQNTTETPVMFLWDVRFQAKPVLQYSTTTGRRDAAKDARVDFAISIDRDESVITSVLPGCDYCVRIWSIKSGELVMKYPSELKKDADYITAASFTRDWYGVRVAVHGEGTKFLSFQS